MLATIREMWWSNQPINGNFEITIWVGWVQAKRGQVITGRVTSDF